jgi:hypothetical protein
MLCPGEIRHHGPATGCDQNMLRSQRAPAHLHRMRIDQHSAARDDLHARSGEQARIHAVEARDFPVFGGDQPRPVETARTHTPAKARSFLKITVVMRGIRQQFLGDTADVDASAAQFALFNQRHAGTESGRHAACAYST